MFKFDFNFPIVLADFNLLGLGVTTILILQIRVHPTNTTFYWDFGDGNNSTLENPTHQYLNPGIHGNSYYFFIRRL